MSIELNPVDLQVIRGINSAVRSRGADWRYPNSWLDGARVEGKWDACDLLIEGDSDWVDLDGTCYNLLPNGYPACIIGFIAVDQGLKTQRVSNATDDAEEWGASGPVRLAMTSAQRMQDKGFTWGVAHDEFYGRLTEHGATEAQIAEWKEP